jgi:hypothetical protein
MPTRVSLSLLGLFLDILTPWSGSKAEACRFSRKV